MLSIDRPLGVLASELETQALILSKEKASPGWLHPIRKWWRPQPDSWASLRKSCHSLLDRIEKIPVTFCREPESARAHNANHLACLKAAHAVQTALFHATPKPARPQLHRLMQKVIALQYRMERVNGGLDRKPVHHGLKEQLIEKASLWKKQLPLAVEKELIPQELRQLEKAAAYPEFTRLLLASKELQENFFIWALRDGNGVDPFVEFPATCAKMKASFLAARVGRLGQHLFRLEKKWHGDGKEKILSLPFHIRNCIRFVNILDDSQQVELAKGWKLTIREVFEVFANKNREVGNLEFFASTGITNWNSHQLGVWNPATQSYDRIDLTKKEWWRQMPRLETVSKATLEKRLEETIQPGEWIVCAKASRTTPDLDLDTRHGYFEVAIPSSNADQSSYTLYPFGNFARNFPNSLWDLVAFLADTVPGKVTYPDENFFYSQRQQAFHPIKLTENEGRQLMHVIQKELIKAKHGHVIFQLGGENCAFWAQKVLHKTGKILPNFYRLNYVETKPLNPVLKGIFACIRVLPPRFQVYGIAAFDRAFGSHRRKRVVEDGQWVYKSQHTSAPRNDGVIFQPGYLHHQIEQGKLKGRLSFGNSALIG